jgi:hypothetical protein
MNDTMDSAVEIFEEESVPAPPAARVPRSIKKWSENKQKFFYKPLDPEYTKRHYYKHRGDMECSICGTVVTTQMHKHIKTSKCLLVKGALQRAAEKVGTAQETEQGSNTT